MFKYIVKWGITDTISNGVLHKQMAERASHSASHATPSKGYKGSCTTGSTSIHKPNIPETES